MKRSPMGQVLATLMLLGAACGGGETEPEGDSPSREEPGPPPAPKEDIVVEPVRLGSFDALIPRPSSVTAGNGELPLTQATTILVEDGADAAAAARLLRSYLAPVTGWDLPLDSDDGGTERPETSGRVIRFSPDATGGLGPEGYELRIQPDSVDIVAAEAPGFGWAVQTLRQMLPPEVEGSETVPGTFALPTGMVRDTPRLAWRGTMLDVARHFFPPEDVERVIDIAATYKLNILHLHLTDDQGWRLEIQKYPELTAIGGSTQVGGGPGGFYTQDEYRHLVEYAAERGVTIVPEIDMPGHTNAALVSLPELNCDGRGPEPYTGTQVGFSSLCIDLERTYEFVDDVIGEVAALTPGPYIHIGGDEAHQTSPADYQRFIERAVEIVRSHGKTPVGWGEIATVELGAGGDTGGVGADAAPAGVVAQHWRDGKHAVAAARQGMGVVMSPAHRTYLDMKYGDFSQGNSWAGHIDTRTAYEWDPQTDVEGVPAEAVIGVEAPLWTELVTTRERIEEMLLPRLPGYAELGWSSAEGRAWEEYRPRLAAQAPRWEAAGWAYTKDPVVGG